MNHKEEQRLWRERHPERNQESYAKYRKSHPEKSVEHKRSFGYYFQTTYSRMKYRCSGKTTERYAGLYCMNKDEWKKFLDDTLSERWVLWARWSENGYKRKLSPSIDRVDTKLGYLPSNCRWITHSENSRIGAKSAWLNGKRIGVR